MINKLVRGSIEMALLSIVYQEENDNRHVHIDRRPCNESVKHERERERKRKRKRNRERKGGGRGRDDTKKHKLHNLGTEPTYYHIRWMGEIVMFRERLIRTIRDLEEGEVGGKWRSGGF